VYAYGVAGHGSAISRRLSSAIVGIEADSNGQGYWIAEAGGAILHFGNAQSYGEVSKGAHMKITAFAALS
jgi:hypothetical protein